MKNHKFAFGCGQLLVSIAAFKTAWVTKQPFGVAGATLSGIEAIKKIKESLPSEARSLANKIAKKLEGSIRQLNLSADERALVMQMLEAGFPSPDEIVKAKLSADAIIERMISKLTDLEHQQLGIQDQFRRLLKPCLENLLRDENFISEMSPLILKSIMDDTHETKKKIDNIEKIIKNKEISLDQLVALAHDFGIRDPEDYNERKLYQLLQEKANEFRSLKQQIDALEIISQEVDALRKAASEALMELNFSLAYQKLGETRNLIAKEQLQKPLEMNATLAEQQAKIALLHGDVQHAYEILSDTADSFAGVNSLEPARRRKEYGDQLYRHGERYGGDGARFAEKMLNHALERVEKKTKGPLYAALQVSLGNALSVRAYHMSGKEGRHLRKRAIEAYRKALRVWTPEEHPNDWAGTLTSLGAALRREAERVEEASEVSQLLAEAINLHRRALSVLTRERHPQIWAMTMGNLGNTICKQVAHMEVGEARFTRLTEAIEAYQNALSVWTQNEHPQDWAKTQTNLAGALTLLAEHAKEETKNPWLAKAVKALRTTLNAWTREEHPLDWAAIQMNLGYVLFKHASTMKGEAAKCQLEESIEASLKVLTIFTRKEHSHDWAVAKANLGYALGALAAHGEGKKRKELLKQAKVAFADSLDVLSKETDAAAWHLAYNGLAITKRLLSKH